MKVTITSNEKVTVKEIDKDLGIFFSEVGKELSEVLVPNTVKVECEEGNAIYNIISRSGTRCVLNESNSIHLQQTKIFPEKYLVMVNSDHNNYKFYHLKQIELNGEIKAVWGRIGAPSSERSCMYQPDMFWTKYFEKLSKGYEDKTDLYICQPDNISEISTNSESNIAKAPNQASVDLYNLLKRFSKQVVERTVVNSNITEAMVKESKRLLNILYEKTTVEEFNETLLELLAICPRKVGKVYELLAKSPIEFPKIIDREETLVDAMDALVIKKSNTSGIKEVISSFEDLDIEVFLATDRQKEQVLFKLNDDLKRKVKNVYRVIPKKQQKIFDDYVKKNGIKEIKQLWHGSRNENWLSIINNGLLLKPNAVITGKMFGDGVYFAPKASKSWNYTSYYNTYWAKGNSDTAFMALFATAYGKPLNCYNAHHYTASEVKKAGCDCVHAHEGPSLRNDEIIFYDEAATVMNYIVEFGS